MARVLGAMIGTTILLWTYVALPGGVCAALLAAIAPFTLATRQKLSICLFTSYELLQGLALSTVTFVVLPLATQQFDFFQMPAPQLTLLCCLITATLLRRFPEALPRLTVLTPALYAMILLGVCGGSFLIRDDHAAFLYRLMQLHGSFPSIPLYNPLWNGGVEAREFFPSGALNTFLLTYPLARLFPLPAGYNAVVATLLFFITPGCSALAARMLGLCRAQQMLAATLAVTSSVLWYRWSLSYGTLGFITSAALYPVVLACCLRSISTTTPATLIGAAFGAMTTALMLFWSISIVALFPACIAVLLRIRHVLSSRANLVALLLLITIVAPWSALFIESSKLFSFLHENSAHVESYFPPSQIAAASIAEDAPLQFSRDGSQNQAEFESSFRQALLNFHPLLILFAAPGALMLGQTAAALFLSSLVWLMALGSLGALIAPHLELSRMLTFLAPTAAVTASVALHRIIQAAASRRYPDQAASVILGAMLVAGAISIGVIVSNRGSERYTHASPVVAALSEAIREHSADSRTLFAGFTLHELDGGHLAPLAAMTGRPLFASSYQHDVWRYIDVIPAAFRKRGEPGVDEFLDLYNIGAIITHDRFWARWFGRRKEKFKQVASSGRFRLFVRLVRPPGWVVSGQATVLSQRGDSVDLKVESDPVILRFNYWPHLVSPGCNISPFTTPHGIRFIKLTGCKGAITSVQMKGPLQRLKSLLSGSLRS